MIYIRSIPVIFLLQVLYCLNTTAQSFNFICIGNANYKYSEADTRNFDDLIGARESAEIVASTFAQYGSGILLRSNASNLLSRCDIFNYLDKLVNISLLSVNSTIVFYYCGHGFSDSLGNVYIVPGEHELGKKEESTRSLLNLAELQAYVIYMVRQKVNANLKSYGKNVFGAVLTHNLPKFVFLLDCCSDKGITRIADILDYDNIEVCPEVYDHKTFLTEISGGDYADKLKMVKYKAKDITVLAGTYGSPVRLVEPFRAKSITTRVGPIARRTMKYFRHKRRDFYVNNFIEKLRQNSFDKHTSTSTPMVPKTNFWERLEYAVTDGVSWANFLFGRNLFTNVSFKHHKNYEVEVISPIASIMGQR